MPRLATRPTPRPTARAVPALALAAALGLAGTTPALADPPAPAATDLVGVGAQGTESLFNQFSTDYNASLAAAGDTTSPRLYSWDSTGTTPITTKSGATAIARPFNSDTGIVALNANSAATLDFSRSTRPPGVGDPADTLFVLLAKDAVTWAAPAGGNAPAGLSTAQLRAIYRCTVTNWRQLDPALPDATIRPVLAGRLTVSPFGVSGPMADTSSTLLTQVSSPGTTDALVAGPCVSVVERENQGTDAVLHDPNALVPYSVGRYLGQTYGGHGRPGDDPGPLVPRAIDGTQPVDQLNHRISASFGASNYARALFTAVRQAEWSATDAHGVALRAVFGPNGWICRAGAADIRSHGFLPMPGAACGQTVHS
ncbi:hypothetical protein [Kitasatospora sp. NPDC058218]|uniref:hypothetical protein n=1 Tax=Kitasatospora sp. NPDC058218 TaxID=3346385 RepID=UPI0036DF4E92